MSQHGLTLREFIEHCRSQSLEPWQIEVLEALDPDNTTHEEDPMTYEKSTYPQVPGSAETPEQASCPPQAGHDWAGQAQDATPLYRALSETEGLISHLDTLLARLESKLDPVLLQHPDSEKISRGDTVGPVSSAAVRHICEQNDRLQECLARIEDLTDRLEC